MEGYGNENPGAFQSTRPLRGATATTTSSVVHALFQPMRPLRGATAPLWRRSRRSRISTHAPLAGRDSARSTGLRRWLYFNPRAPCGARRAVHNSGGVYRQISTHAPLAGRDAAKSMYEEANAIISTHAPLAGRDEKDADAIKQQLIFQPTRPLRGATRQGHCSP